MQPKLHICHVAFTLDPVFFVASHGGVALPLPTLLYRSLLHWRAPLPYRFSISLELPQIFHKADGVVGIHPIWLLLLSLCLQLAAIDCSCCCKWQAGVLGCAISEYFNQNLLLPKPFGRTTVPLQQQRVSNGFEPHEQQTQQV